MGYRKASQIGSELDLIAIFSVWCASQRSVAILPYLLSLRTFLPVAPEAVSRSIDSRLCICRSQHGLSSR